MANAPQAKATHTSTTETRTSVIAANFQLEGEIQTVENLRLDGTVQGNIQCNKRLIIGSKGKVIGTIKAAEIIINGHLTGEAISEGRLTLGATAVAEGKITALDLIVEEGAVFNGDFSVQKA